MKGKSRPQIPKRSEAAKAVDGKHNPKAAGSSPASATKKSPGSHLTIGALLFWEKCNFIKLISIQISGLRSLRLTFADVA